VTTGADNANIPIGLDMAPVVAELRQLNERFDNSFQRMARSATETNSKIELLKTGLAAVRAVVGFVAEQISTYTKAAIEAERNERRWAIAMQLRQRVSHEALDAQKAFVDQVSQQTAIDDDAILNLQEQLSLMGVRNSRMQEATVATIGLAQVTGSLESAARLYARTQNGSVEALKRYGIEASSAKDATKKLVELYVLATDEVKTLGGQLKLLDVNVGNFQETAGSAVSGSVVAFEGMSALNDITRQFTGYLGSEDGQKLVEEFFDILIASAQGAMTSLEGVVRAVDFIGTRIRENLALATDGFYTEQLDEHGNVAKTVLQEFADQLAIAEGRLQAARDRAAGRRARGEGAPSPTIPRPGGGGGGDGKEADKHAKEVEKAIRAELELHERFNNQDAEIAARRIAQQSELSDQLRLNQINRENDERAHQQKTQQEAIAHNEKMLEIGFGSAEQQAQLAQSIIASNAEMLSSLVEGFLSGENDAKAAAEKFFGAVLKSIGTYLVALGGANIIGGLWPPNPTQVAAGFAQVALGAILAGGGAFIAGAAGRRDEAARERDQAAKETQREREREERERDRVRRERAADSSGSAFSTNRLAPINVTYVLQLQGFGIGSPAMFGRQAMDAMRAADRLSSGRMNIGG